jgi:hypothetical protein
MSPETMLMLDGRDVRSVGRKVRRAAGFHGPAFTQPAPSLPRFTRRHFAAELLEGSPARTRRQRKLAARIKREVARRGLK